MKHARNPQYFSLSNHLKQFYIMNISIFLAGFPFSPSSSFFFYTNINYYVVVKQRISNVWVINLVSLRKIKHVPERFRLFTQKPKRGRNHAPLDQVHKQKFYTIQHSQAVTQLHSIGLFCFCVSNYHQVDISTFDFFFCSYELPLRF